MIDRIFNSKIMVVFLAALTLFSAITPTWIEGVPAELITYTVMATIGVLACLFSKSLLVWAPAMMMCYISPSLRNNPFIYKTSFFYPENGNELWYILGLAGIVLLALLLRVFFIKGLKESFKGKKSLLIGLLLWCAVMLLGGTNYAGFDNRHFTYVGLLSAALLVPYFVLTTSVDWKKVPKDYFAFVGVVIGLVVAAQLANIYYVRFDAIIQEGTLYRSQIFCGWGTYTSMAAVLLFCLPCAFYLAATKKGGCIYNVIGQLLMLTIVLSTGRGSTLVGALMYIGCAIFVFKQKKNRKQNLVVYLFALAVLLGVAVYAVAQYPEKLEQLVALLKKGTDSGRFVIYEDGWNRFMQNPVFGQGFYACIATYQDPVGGAFIPGFMHNTILQMLASCGVVGLVGYLVHRVQTLVTLFTKPSLHKSFVWLSIFGILVNCLLDCHLFNIGVTIMYSVALAFMQNAHQMKK